MLEVGGSRSEVIESDEWSEIRSWRSEVRGQTSEFRGQTWVR